MQIWIIFSILSSLTAALVAVLGKMGLKNLDPTLATTIRSVIMAAFLIAASLGLKKFNNLSSQSMMAKDWILIILAGVAGALSWLFYFWALKTGDTTKVAAIDRTSLAFVAVFSILFLGETFKWQQIVGLVLMVGGAILISLF
jgi:bacterial/archaeal transporter family protein